MSGCILGSPSRRGAFSYPFLKGKAPQQHGAVAMNHEAMENTIVARCNENHCSLATAESCTGGLISHRITNVPGASSIFLGGVIAYANEAKSALLGVSQALLAEKGAVSQEVALAMARGAQHRFHSDYAVAVTGIAGPGGGSPEKPVGTVYLAVVSPTSRRVIHRLFVGDRDAIKVQTADEALNLLSELMDCS